MLLHPTFRNTLPAPNITRNHLSYTFRVRPKKITHGTIMRNLLFAIYRSYLVQCLNRGGQATVDTKDLQQERNKWPLGKLHIQGTNQTAPLGQLQCQPIILSRDSSLLLLLPRSSIAVLKFILTQSRCLSPTILCQLTLPSMMAERLR